MRGFALHIPTALLSLHSHNNSRFFIKVTSTEVNDNTSAAILCGIPKSFFSRYALETHQHASTKTRLKQNDIHKLE